MREGLWRAEGLLVDGTGNSIAVQGEAQIRHYPDRWIYEGVLRAAAVPPVEQRTVYDIQPMAPGNFATPWSSKSAAFGTLQGRFVVVGDTILSAYVSATGRYRGQDTMVRRDERHYSARGMLLQYGAEGAPADGGKLLSAWRIELNL